MFWRGAEYEQDDLLVVAAAVFAARHTCRENRLATHSQIAALCAVVLCADASVAAANPLVRPAVAPGFAWNWLGRSHPPPRPPKPTVIITAAARLAAKAAGWQEVTAAAPFGANGAGTPLLLTDGTVLIGDNTSNYYALTPDKTGNYINGTWTKKASLPSGYGPLYFASAVLADGKVVVNGGEYNFFKDAETNLGAIYDPVADAWKSVLAPTGWSQIGDGQSVVLADGTYMLGNCCYNTQAELDEAKLTWKIVGAKKFDSNSEEGWTLLTSGNVLTADVIGEPNSEIFNAATGSWSTAGKIPVDLTQAVEIGPQILRPDGTVFVAGASGATAVYSTVTGKWVAGPSFPKVGGQQVDIADGPASLLTNGNVIMAASPGVYKAPSYFYIFNGTKLAPIPGPPNAPNDPSYAFRLMILPTGQILATDGSNDVEIYTPKVKPLTSIAPVITNVPATVAHGSTYTITGKLFNGVSQANAYGDDAQSATNYPLVAITNVASGHVVFARTHDHTSMAVGSSSPVSTLFDVPPSIELGASKLVVVANGIQSAPANITVK